MPAAKSVCRLSCHLHLGCSRTPPGDRLVFSPAPVNSLRFLVLNPLPTAVGEASLPEVVQFACRYAPVAPSFYPFRAVRPCFFVNRW